MREQYALGVAGAFTSVLVVIWLVAISSGADDPNERMEEADRNQQPFGMFFENIGAQVSKTRDSLRSAVAESEVDADARATAETGLVGEAPTTTSSQSSNENDRAVLPRIELSNEEVAMINANRATTATSSEAGPAELAPPRPSSVVLIGTTSRAKATTSDSSP